MGRVVILAVAVLLLVLAMGVAWVARTFMWFGPSPAVVNYPAKLHDLARTAVGLGSGGEDSWPLIEAVVEATITAEEDATGERVSTVDGRVSWVIDYTVLRERDGDPRMLALARAGLEELERAGVPDLLDQLAANPGAARPEGAAGDLIAEEWLDRYAARHLVLVQCAKFAMAYRAGDEAGAARELSRGLAVARVIGHQPLAIDWFLGVAATASLTGCLREEFAIRRPSPPMAREVLALVRGVTTAPLALTLEGERLTAFDAISSLLGDSPVKIASRGAQMAKLDEFYKIAIRCSRDPAGARDPAIARQLEEFEAALGLSYAPVGILLPAITRMFEADDQRESLHAGTVVMVAIEAYAAEHGRVPARLSDLVPGLLAEVPGDPFRREGFVYRVVDPASDPQARAYLLYSVGRDGADNGGLAHPKLAASAFVRAGAGHDFVFNASAAAPADASAELSR